MPIPVTVRLAEGSPQPVDRGKGSFTGTYEITPRVSAEMMTRLAAAVRARVYPAWLDGSPQVRNRTGEPCTYVQVPFTINRYAADAQCVAEAIRALVGHAVGSC